MFVVGGQMGKKRLLTIKLSKTGTRFDKCDLPVIGRPAWWQGFVEAARFCTSLRTADFRGLRKVLPAVKLGAERLGAERV